MSAQVRNSAEPLFEVVWPLGKEVSKPADIAASISDLNGKTVCELWDWLYRGDLMYQTLNEELRKKYPGIKIIDHKTMGNIHGDNEREYVETLPALLRQHGCDAVITAIGA